MTKEKASRRKPFDLEERTAQFGAAILRFAKTLPINAITSSLVVQLVKAGTSVGANYGEANEAGSKKAFKHIISICRRESKECQHWLRMIAVAVPSARDRAKTLWSEAKELHLIFNAIFRNTE